MRIVDDQIRLLPATGADTEFARGVHHSALREAVVRQFGSWDEELQDGFFERSGFPTGFEIVEFEGSRCGYFRIESSATHVDVHNLYLHPDYQRKGIGTRLLRLAIKQAANSQLPVRLQVLHENTKAAALYQRLGFEVIGSTDTHFQMRLEPEINRDA